MSDPTLATEEAEVVGARVQARFVDRKERGEHLPLRPTVQGQVHAPVEPATVDAKVQLLRAEFEDALREIGTRIRAVGSRADAAAARAEQAVAAGQALAEDLGRISSVLPPDVAVEVDAAVERFLAGLRSA